MEVAKGKGQGRGYGAKEQRGRREGVLRGTKFGHFDNSHFFNFDHFQNASLVEQMQLTGVRVSILFSNQDGHLRVI
jgi:hypothetical protein